MSDTGRRADMDLLFVYGTLMRQSRRPAASRLAAESTSLGAATVCAQLYNLGSYPGVQPSDNPRDEVHGAVLKLRRAQHSLRWIDSYEGCGEGEHEPHGFERVPIYASLIAGRRLQTWIYIYRGPVGHARRLQSGRYYPAKSLIRLHS